MSSTDAGPTSRTACERALFRFTGWQVGVTDGGWTAAALGSSVTEPNATGVDTRNASHASHSAIDEVKALIEGEELGE